MKRLVVVNAVLALAMSLMADTEIVGEYTWTYRINGDTAEVCKRSYDTIAPNFAGIVIVPSMFGGKPVTSIGEWAFAGFQYLTQLEIPISVTNIGANAFSGCVGLSSITIPHGVTCINSGLFYGCTSLIDVFMLGDLTAIGDAAFMGSGLQDIRIPASVTYIGNQAFQNCHSLTNIIIQDGIKFIGNRAFSGCDMLQHVAIPGSVQNVEWDTFYGCSKILDVVIETGVKSIGARAFESCISIQNVAIPSSLSSIESHAFYNCSSLAMVRFDGAPPITDTSAFSNVKSGAMGTYTAAHKDEWEAVIDVDGYWKGLKMQMIDTHAKVQLWEGGPYWATTNIGADNPEDYGLYFWWGDTTGHLPSSDGAFSFSFDGSCPTYNKSIYTLQSEGWIVSKDGTYILAPAHDAAHVKWGGGWRMPTYQELYDLEDKCDWAWTTKNGVSGYVVRGRSAYSSNSIFLPAGGRVDGAWIGNVGSYGDYWASVPNSDSYLSRHLNFGSASHVTHIYGRYCGFSIRPVQGLVEEISDEGAVVSFNVNGGTGAMEAQTFENGEVQKLSKNTYRKDGYVFQGWASNSVDRANSGIVDYADEQEITVDSDLTLYAVWKKPYDFFICFHGGYSASPKSEVYQGFWFHEGTAQYLDGCPFHRADNEFLGWSVGTADFDWMDNGGQAVDSLWPDHSVVLITQEDLKYYKSIGAMSEDGVVPILHLYAIWTTTVPIKFFNKSVAGSPKLVLPPGLADHITWSTLYDPSPRHGEGHVELPPGRHILCVDVDPGYTEYVNGFMHDDSISADPNVGYKFRCNSVGTRWAYDFTLDGKVHFDTLNVKVRPMVSESGGLTVNCSSSMTPDEQANWPDDQAFDIGKVTISLQRYVYPYPEPLYLNSGEEVMLPAGEYSIELEYNGEYWSPSSNYERINIVEGKYTTFSSVFSPANYRTYSVVFDPNGGTVSPKVVRIDNGLFRYYEDGYWKQRLPEPKREDGREFKGWFTKKVGGEKVSVKMLESGYHFEPLTLYAHWSDLFIPENPESVPEDATDVVVSWGVTYISESAFEYCSGLQSITFKGDAPMVESGAFNRLTNNCVVYVSRSSKGWGVGIPGTWNGLRIEYNPELISELAPGIAPDEVTNAVESIGFADAAVKTVIGGDVDEYNRFRIWAQRLRDEETDVVFSTRAAMSYLLGADELILNDITSNDVHVAAFGVGADNTAGSGSQLCRLAFEVSIDGVNIGGGSVGEETLKANMKKVLGLEGSATLTSDAFSEDNIDIVFDTPANGKARFTATPPVDAGNTYFMRVKVK